MEREYDEAGNRTALTDPEGKQTSYEYDAVNRLTSVTDGQGAKSTYSYDDDNRPTGISYPNGAGESLAYDPLGRVSSATATGTGGSVLSKLSYSYDANSNPTSITNEKNEQSTFAYDALDRLTQEAHPQKKSLSYTYDAAGNRQSMTEGATTTNYAYDAAERMTRAGSDTFSYDANGNMTGHTNGSTTTDYSYDSKARLIQAGEKTYQRDAFGRVASSTEGGTKTDYLFDGQQVIQEKKQAGDSSATTSYTRGLGGRLVSRRAGSGAPSYYHHDAIGSVIGLSDSAGKLTDTYAYDAFGNGRARTGTSEQPYGYLGNAYEPSTKLYDFHARHYDPKNGRFLSKDPIKGLKSKPQTLNPYSYGVNGPLAHPDPSGRCIEFCFPDPVYFTDEFKDLGGECAPVAAIGAGDQCSSGGGGSEEEGATEPVNGVEDFTQNDEAPTPPEETGGEGDSYLNEGDQAEQPPLPDMEDGGDSGGDSSGGDLPVYTVNSNGDQPNIEANDRYAIEELGAPQTLTYTKDPNIRKANNDAACGDFEAEGSCDEYPYQSTYEGAANPDYPYSVADVPPKENSTQGGELSQFYQRNNLQEGNRFRVKLPEEE